MDYPFKKPILMPRGSHYGSDYWIAYSFKVGRTVHFYSMLEYAHFLCLEMDHSIDYFCEQPLKIENIFDSHKKSSVFDFWVCYKNGEEEFQEVKYSNELFDKTDAAMRSQKQIDFQRKWCESNNYKYRVVTEETIYKGEFYFQNLKVLQSNLLRCHAAHKFDPSILIKNLSVRNMTLLELKKLGILPDGQELSVLAYQLYLGNIKMSLEKRPLDFNTEVYL